MWRLPTTTSTTYDKIGTTPRRLALPLRKDDARKKLLYFFADILDIMLYSVPWLVN